MTTTPTVATSPLVATMRDLALNSPNAAIADLDRLLDTPHVLADPPQRADLLAVRAEAWLRAGDPQAASRASAEAVGAAAGLHPQDPARLITALLIDADVMLYAGAAHQAIAASNRARDVSARYSAHHLPRHQLTLALHTVVVYRHIDCRLARLDLSKLHHQLDPGCPLAVIVEAGLTAMRDGCRPGPHRPPTAPAPPLPTGLLHPGLDTDAASYLPHRILAAPSFHHDHSAPAARSGNAASGAEADGSTANAEVGVPRRRKCGR